MSEIDDGESFLVTNRHNLRYLCGFTGTNGQMLFSRRKAYFFTDLRYAYETGKILPPNVKLVKIEKNPILTLEKILSEEECKITFFEPKDLRYSAFESLKKSLKGIPLLPKYEFVENFRIIKDDKEIANLTKSQSINEKAFMATRDSLHTGMTEIQIAWMITRFTHEFGAEDISFPPVVAIGKNSGTPHHQNSGRKLKKGDMILIDMGARYKGYCSDMTRMIFTGQPTSFEKKVYKLVLEAQGNAIVKIKAGLTGKQCDAFARDIINDAGFEKNFNHSLGHGVGLQIHEEPAVSPESVKILPKNTIITVEPGIYMEEKFGIRIEDMAIIGEKSIKLITKTPKSIESSIINLKN